MKPVEVLAGIIARDGKFLIGRRKAAKRLGGFWEFPGGKREPNETPQQCLEREIWEEFGIRIRAGEFLAESSHTYAFGAIRLLAYRAEYLSGDPVPTDHDEIRWIRPDELGNFTFAPADIPIVERLQQA